MPTCPKALHELLSEAGYEIRFRGGSWVECLVLRERERWLGRGVSEDAALADAVEHMLPSHVGRELLAQVLSRSAPCVAPAVQAAPAAEAPAAEAPPEPEPSTEQAPVTPVSASGGAPIESPRVAAEPGTGGPNVAEALGSLDAIVQDIETQLATFGRLSPSRQRTFLLIWICRARSFEDALPHEREVHRRIGVIARRLSDLAKTFWPGSVRALQLTARPWDVPELRVRGAAAPRSWTEASERADRVLDEQLAEAEKLGLDADGWLDDAAGPPTGQDPAQAQASAVAAVEAVLKGRGDDPDALDAAAIDALTSAARRLRRLRRFGDGVAWGMVIGKLRRLAPGLGARGARLREVLDPTRRG